jgi:hypothetical protein
MPNDDWLLFINKRAALREQFPTLRDVLKERPGSASDIRKQRQIAEDNQASKNRAARERWERSVEENARREERLRGERRRRAYNLYQAEKHQKDIA